MARQGGEDFTKKIAHEVVPVCVHCGEKLVADYDGEIWHESERERYEDYLATLSDSSSWTPELDPGLDTRTLREKVMALVKNLTSNG